MQTQKASNGSPDVPKKVSPRAARPLKITALEPDSPATPISANNRTPKNKSPKFLDRRSPRSPVSEKKRPSRITELESLVSQLQEELKKAKDQVTVSETSKKQAEKEAEESRKQLEELSSKLQETHNQECDLKSGASADEREGLSFVVEEIRQLKLQIENVASSEANHMKQAELRNSEIHLLRGNLMDTLFLVENFRNQVRDCEVSEAETEALATETLRQLENAKKAVEELKSDGANAVESYKKMAGELEHSKSRMVLLEGLVTKDKDYEEVPSLRSEVERLREALEASDRKGQEGSVEASSRLRIQAELQSELKIARSEIDELKARLVDKEAELEFVSEEKDNLYLKETDVEAELKQLKEEMENLKADVMDKETELQIVSDENETLKSDMNQRERDVQDVLVKLGIAMEEADKSSKRAVRVAEQLDATQASNSEMEIELRKLKVQSNQWRKAAEAATAMLSAGNNGKCDKTNSPYSEDVDDEVAKKKNGNVLKKIGVLWKKNQK
ncbi:interactor of constitutive active ROPs 3-like [Brassica napus]|uniref:interactor of constitutive active ROPs 3-like n=1 Tax=Brassica napus TaxID=3708 RepID=UPI0020790922|nr:interactor of constitutive active ROPs 3-like [Brassica napus]XP_013715829.2 interactor of constitutive active ROPs 3-like [Brassica napus]XP_013715830.2 interactor of constitutive active ROPs 3-like [Brassica napus]